MSLPPNGENTRCANSPTSLVSAFPASCDCSNTSVAPAPSSPNPTAGLDNLQPHKNPAVIAAIEGVGARVELLPVYSPDLTPIEEMFSKTKSYLRTVAARTTEAVIHALGKALEWVTQCDILGWFHDRCPYAKLK